MNDTKTRQVAKEKRLQQALRANMRRRKHGTASEKSSENMTSDVKNHDKTPPSGETL